MHSYEMPFNWICVAVHAQCKTKQEVLIEHIRTSRGTSTGYSYNRRGISADAHRTGAIAYTVFVFGHIQGVGVTAYHQSIH